MSSKQERRKYKRLNIINLSLPVDLKVEGWDTAVPAVLLNISPNGLGIMIFKKLDTGTTVNIRLSIEGLKTETITARVVWVREHDDTFREGLKFTSINAKDFFKIHSFVHKS